MRGHQFTYAIDICGDILRLPPVAALHLVAEKYMRAVGVDSHSWWQVHPHVVDCLPGLDEGNEVHFYSHRGSPLMSAPLKRAMAAFQKHVGHNPDIYGPSSSDGA